MYSYVARTASSAGESSGSKAAGPPPLGGSWDLVSMVISTLTGLISNYKYSYLNNNLVTKSHDPLSKVPVVASRWSRASITNWMRKKLCAVTIGGVCGTFLPSLSPAAMSSSSGTETRACKSKGLEAGGVP